MPKYFWQKLNTTFLCFGQHWLLKLHMRITLCGHLPQPPLVSALRGEVEFQLPLPISSQLSIQSLQSVSSGSQCCPKHKNVVFNFCQKYFGIFKRGVRQRHSFHLLKLKNTVQFAKKNWKNIYSKNTYLNYIMELSELVRTSDFCMILWLWHQFFTQWYLT